MSKGSDLENTSLSWLDTLDGVADGTVKGQNRLLAAATESMMGDLRTAYSKYTQSGGKSNAYTAGQLAARIENTLELLPPKARQRLEGMYQADLAKAQEIGRKAGVDLDKINDQKKNKTTKANAKPNTDAMKAAGRRLGTFWGDENSKLTDRVKALTRQAALEGKSWRQLSLQIRELLSNDKTQNDQSRAKTKRMGLAQRAELIARTEMGFAFIEGQKDNFKKNGYEFVRWSAAGERTCGYCISRDGLVYQVDEIDGAIPAHPRCRCSLIPVDAPSLKKGKGGPTGPEAADELDDSYWSKSRKAKMDRWKEDQNLNGKGEPKQILKSNSELDQALRDFSQTPTNTERWFRPNAGAAMPVWAPSGNIIPDMTAAAKNAQDAADKPRRDAEEADRKRLKDEADRAEQEARKAEAKKADDALFEKEFGAVSKAFGDKGTIDPTKFRNLPKGDRDRLVKAANDKLAKEAAEAAARKKAQKTPQEVIDAGLEAGWKVMNPEQQAKLLDTVKKMAAKAAAVAKAEAQASKQAKALEGKVVGKKRIEDRTAEKVVAPKTGQIKPQDFSDALKMLTGQGGLVGLNTQRFMKFQERYNISTITGTGGESRIEHLLGSRQLRSSLKAAQARKTATNKFGGGNDKVFREILKELDDYGRPGAIIPGWAKKHMTVDKRDGVGGSTADGMGAVKVKTAKYHKKVDAKSLKELQEAVEDSVIQANKGNPYELTSSKAAKLTINRKNYRFDVAEGEWLTTYIHEMGHQLHYAVGAPMPPLGARKWNPSKYGITNKHEWFAETFTQYTLAPAALKRYAPDAYDFIDQSFKRAMTGRPGEVGRAKQLGEEPPRAVIREDLVKKATTKLSEIKAKKSAETQERKKDYYDEVVWRAEQFGISIKAATGAYAKAIKESGMKPGADYNEAIDNAFMSAMRKAGEAARQEALRGIKAKNSAKVAIAKKDYLDEIDYRVKTNKITRAEAIDVYAKAVKKTKFKNGRSGEDLEDDFFSAISKGAKDQFAKTGIDTKKMVAEARAEALAKKQAKNLGTVDTAATKGQAATKGTFKGKTSADRVAEQKLLMKDSFDGGLTRQGIKDTFNTLASASGASGANFRTLMDYAERYNISTVMGSGGQTAAQMPYATRGKWAKQLESSIKSSQARGDSRSREWGETALLEIKNRRKGSNASTPLLDRDLDVDPTFGVNGTTAKGWGFTKIKTLPTDKPIDRGTFEQMRSKVEQGIREAADFNAPANVKSGVNSRLIKGPNGQALQRGDHDWVLTHIHEMGHQIHFAAGSPKYRGKDRYSPSQYGRTNKEEWFAETLVQYTIAPNALKTSSPEAFRFVDKIVKRAMSDTPGRVNRWTNNGTVKPDDLFNPAEVQAKQKGATVPELKAMAKEAGLKGYSKLTKPQLIEALSKTRSAGTPAPAKTQSSPASASAKPKAADLAKQTVKQLQAEAKTQGLTGYSKLKKPDLIKALEEKAAPKAAGIKKKAAPKKNLTQAEKDFKLVNEQLGLSKEQWSSKSAAAKTLTLKTAAKKAAAPKLTPAEVKAKEAKAKYEAALEAKAQKKLAADIAKLDAEVAAKAAKAAAKSANKAVEDQIAAINKEIKAISQKALTGQKVTAAEQKRAAELQKQKRELMQEESGDVATKIDRTTTDVEHIYRAKDFKAYGYNSRAEMTSALQKVAEYTDEGYKRFMNAQWAQKLQAGGKLTAYETARAKEAIKNKNALKLQRDMEAAEELEAFIAKAPKYDGLVMRGLHMADDASALQFIKNLGKGTATNSVESWSDDYATAEQFSNGRKGMVGIVLSVQNKSGVPIAGASNFSTESEVLVPGGQRYRVKNVTKRIDEDLEIGGNKQVIYDVDLEIID